MSRKVGLIWGISANVLVNEERITLIDLDELAYGDPMVDVGRLLASLRVPALRAYNDLNALAPAGEAFLEEYLALTSESECRARLFEAASLLIAAASSFRIQRAGWEEQVCLLLEESDRILSRSSQKETGAVLIKAEREQPGISDWIKWAGDEVYMQSLLAPHVRQTYGAELLACRGTLVDATEKAYQVRYQLSGYREGEKWNASMEGMGRLYGSRFTFKCLENLRNALDGSPEAPRLPRPVAYLPALSLVVVEKPKGTSLPSLIGSPDALDAATCLGKALAAVHNVHLPLESGCSIHEEMQALKSRVGRLLKTAPQLWERAEALLAEIEHLSDEITPETATTIPSLHPQHVLWNGSGTAIVKVDKITRSRPSIYAGNFLARLTLMGITRGQIPQTENVTDHFRYSRLSAGVVGERELAIWESTALLRLCCIEMTRNPSGPGDLLLSRSSAIVTRL